MRVPAAEISDGSVVSISRAVPSKHAGQNPLGASRSKAAPHVSQTFVGNGARILLSSSFSRARKYRTKPAQLIVDFMRRADCLEDFAAKRVGKLASQPMNQSLHCSKPHAEARGCIFVGDAGFFAFQKWRERFEQYRLPMLSKV